MGARFWNRLSHERELWRKGMSVVAGVDEAGCGPLAGPVVAAAVVFPCAWLEAGLCSTLRGLNDSKQLTAEERDKFFCALTSHPEIRHAIASVDVEMIDRINIRQAAWRAMQLALDRLDPRPEHVLIDGLRIKWLPYAHTALVQGDCRSYTIAAASVLAKVSRDRMMTELAQGLANVTVSTWNGLVVDFADRIGGDAGTSSLRSAASGTSSRFPAARRAGSTPSRSPPCAPPRRTPSAPAPGPRDTPGHRARSCRRIRRTPETRRGPGAPRDRSPRTRTRHRSCGP
jgi:ribonuclease HII